MSDDKVPEKMRGIYDEIVALTDAVCGKHLSQEYADLSRKMAADPQPQAPFPADQWPSKNLGGGHRLRAWSSQLPVR